MVYFLVEKFDIKGKKATYWLHYIQAFCSLINRVSDFKGQLSFMFAVSPKQHTKQNNAAINENNDVQ